MAVTLAAWLQVLQAYLPPGRALTREPGAWLTRLLEAFAAMLLAAQLRVAALVAEFDPLLATSLLPDWERLLGLPDDCMVTASLTTLDRQRIASQRLHERGGQSRAYFIDLADRLGEPGCTVTEFRPMTCNDDCNDALYSTADLYTWRVNIPHAAVNARQMNCNDNCNAALQMYLPSLAECPIRERKPAHTQVIFAYTA
ncbi:Uncharacterized protein YmfQ in lambdoid prophage, DUF2313 family [Rhodoferax sp. OV413]|uniref:YmfQ family protein n=1 Tax=Rhodoferax sp. OV413 TaxID=1855285 RepID=UPI00088FDD28|nr:putative phage tail protein [Rhodoferax sp. OV413]SDO75872.1 Uncharacterized protein YmfQ in lambdoid prophage, DUF2313 family [Rhodoferax sp. OV413]